MADYREKWQRYRDEVAVALAAGDLPAQVATDMELNKRDRQERSRGDVQEGRTAVDDNFLIPRAIARKFTYKFK